MTSPNKPLSSPPPVDDVIIEIESSDADDADVLDARLVNVKFTQVNFFGVRLILLRGERDTVACVLVCDLSAWLVNVR